MEILRDMPDDMTVTTESETQERNARLEEKISELYNRSLTLIILVKKRKGLNDG